MNRRQHIENIIVGTLLDSTEDRNYWSDCRSCVCAEMFADKVNARMFGLIADMNGGGKVPSPYGILVEYGQAVIDIVEEMCERCTEYSFDIMRTRYNEERYLLLLSQGVDYGYTNVQFSDYVNQFITMAYEGIKS